jgi:hypothetical protein
MPDVVGDKLDSAQTAIKDAGFDDDVEVDGGGIFGVIDESNWVVCEQSPKAGDVLTKAPRLAVERSCEDDEPESAEPSEVPTEEPSADASETPEEPSVITARTNKDFAALLKLSDYCDPSIGAFARS